MGVEAAGRERFNRPCAPRAGALSATPRAPPEDGGAFVLWSSCSSPDYDDSQDSGTTPRATVHGSRRRD